MTLPDLIEMMWDTVWYQVGVLIIFPIGFLIKDIYIWMTNNGRDQIQMLWWLPMSILWPIVMPFFLVIGGSVKFSKWAHRHHCGKE